MRLAKITACYPDYLKSFYQRNPTLAGKPFDQQNSALNYDAFGWFDVWSNALAPLGYDVLEVTANAEPLQRRWAKENGVRSFDARAVALEQVRRFKPDVIWYDDSDVALLRQLKAEVPGVRLVMGWTGSALSVLDHLQQMDLVLSCAPEAVARLRQQGLRVEHLNHAFDPRIIHRLAPSSSLQRELVFVGQIIRGSEFHSAREQLLLALAARNLLSIYSPTRHQPLLDAGVRISRGVLNQAVKSGIPRRLLESLPVAGRLLASDAMPFTVDKRLRKVLKPGVFGLAGYQTLKNAPAALNIHANSSPQFASNARLFEITGAGTCMLTDWKENIPALFKPDTEVVTYASASECVEKARWLLDHPTECAAIAKAGQTRVLAEHTYTHRAHELDRLIRRELAVGRAR